MTNADSNPEYGEAHRRNRRGRRRVGVDMPAVLTRVVVVPLTVATCLVLACLTALSVSVAAPQDAPEPPDDPDTLILSVRHVPGMLASINVELPAVVLYGDGRLIVSAPATGLLLAARRYHLSDAKLRQLYREAYGLGLAQSRQFPGDPDIIDGGATMVTLYAHGRRHVTTLGQRGAAWFGADARILRFAERLTDMAEDLESPTGDPAQYRPERLAVAATVDKPTTMPADVPSWPGPDLLSGVDTRFAGRCTVVTGAALTQVEQLAQSADYSTRWRIGEHLVWLRARPLLPHETSCADLDRP